jgi:hypothetical protein
MIHLSAKQTSVLREIAEALEVQRRELRAKRREAPLGVEDCWPRRTVNALEKKTNLLVIRMGGYRILMIAKET